MSTNQVELRLIGGPLCGTVRHLQPDDFDRYGYAYFTAVLLDEQWVDCDRVPRDGRQRSCVVYRTQAVSNFPALEWSVRMEPLKTSFVRRVPV